MTARRLFVDDAPGERRGVVFLGSAPERLLVERFDSGERLEAQARVAARVRSVDRSLGTAFLELCAGEDGVLPLAPGEARINEGARLEVEVTAVARGRKGPVVRALGPCEGPVRLLSPGPSLEARLSAFAPGAALITGAPAREAADAAEEAALRLDHPLPSGGRIFVEPTQALTAVDVDLGSTSGEGRRAVGRANGEALAAAARVLRLKGLGGLVAVDLAGKGHDGARLTLLAKEAFAPDGEGVSIGPISRFGVLELALPWRSRPLSDALLGRDGQISATTAALRLLRLMERAAGPGQRVLGVCDPQTAEVAGRLAPLLAERIGPRFEIRSDRSMVRAAMEVSAR